MSLAEEKAAARKAAFLRRKGADRSAMAAANRHLLDAIRRAGSGPVSGFLPIRTEIDPTEALTMLAAERDVGLPVVLGDGQPLEFRRWVPGCEMEAGDFGTTWPKAREIVVPEVLIVPLAAFDGRGYRLGYGGGFYDRTLEKLRARGRAVAIGFAFDIQRCERVPTEATDQKLDAMVTEAGAVWFS